MILLFPILKLLWLVPSRILMNIVERGGNNQLCNPVYEKAMPTGHYLLTFDVAVRDTGSITAAVCKTPDDSVVFIQQAS